MKPIQSDLEEAESVIALFGSVPPADALRLARNFLVSDTMTVNAPVLFDNATKRSLENVWKIVVVYFENVERDNGHL